MEEILLGKENCWKSRRKGKQRMRQLGKVAMPQEAFMAILKV